jgi:hypothetical protein
MALYYRYVTKNSDNDTPSGVSVDSYTDSYDIGESIRLNSPQSSSLSIYHITQSSSPSYTLCSEANARKITALTKTINFYRANSPYYDINYYKNKNVTLVEIPSAIYGSSIKKGTVSLKFYVTGNLLAEVKDTKKNGELIEVTGSNLNKTAGIVLYNEGFILLTGSWDLGGASTSDQYVYCAAAGINDNDVAKWIHWGRGFDGAPVTNASFDIDFEGTTKIHTLTMLATAPKSELNYSFNPTYLKFTSSVPAAASGYNFYKENEFREIKNTVKTDFIGVSGSYQPQVFINKIGIYDSEKRLIAVAKLATPVKKTEQRSITFKLKLDT